ncbi:unnamed protein product [Arctogadus glacialis]
MEQRLSRGVLLEMEGEDGHGEDQASGGDPLEGSDLAAEEITFLSGENIGFLYGYMASECFELILLVPTELIDLRWDI